MTNPPMFKDAVVMGKKACKELLQEWGFDEQDYKSLDAESVRVLVLKTGCTLGKFSDGPVLGTPEVTASALPPAVTPEFLSALADKLVGLLEARLTESITSKVMEQVQPKLDSLQQQLKQQQQVNTRLQAELSQVSKQTVNTRMEAELSRVSKQVTLLGSHADSQERKDRSAKARLTNLPVQDGETPATLLTRVQTEVVQGQMKVAGVQLISATRQEQRAPRSYAAATTGEKQAPADRHPAILLEFASPADRLQVLKARRQLQGTKYGLQEDMTPLQQARKRAAWPVFKEAKAAGKKAYWRADKLFVEGVEHHP